MLEGKARKSLVFDTYELALSSRADLLQALKSKTTPPFGEALEEYLESLSSRGVTAGTIHNSGRMLRLFFPLDQPIGAIDAETAERMYLDETRRTKVNGEPIAADTHHLLLRRAKQFYKWAISRRYVDKSPFAEIRPTGRARRGKPQLRIDEARKLVAVAVERARTLDVGATAALMQIFLGLRPTESVIRVVRDLDDDGHVLWIPFGKTSNARRRLQVPEPLREILLKQAHGKPSDAPLLGPPGEGLHTRHALRHRLHQLCADAGVPMVCPHSLRGLNATLALEAGATAHHVAAALGHSSFATTARHYADASTVANANLRKVADVLVTRPERLDVLQLAQLIRQNLSPEELAVLHQSIAPDLPQIFPPQPKPTARN